jgi:uncharacterized membrane protein
LDFANNHINREINKHMSTLVVVGYDDPYKAEEVRFKLRKLPSEYLLDLEDAVVAVNEDEARLQAALSAEDRRVFVAPRQ